MQQSSDKKEEQTSKNRGGKMYSNKCCTNILRTELNYCKETTPEPWRGVKQVILTCSNILVDIFTGRQGGAHVRRLAKASAG